MTKQELENAIKNGESVWCVYKDQSNIYEIKAVEIEKVLSNTFLWGKEYYSNIKDVFKTKAEAEHYLHHANITRTEQLPFLTWEEFDKGDRLIRFIGKNGEKCKLEGYQKDDKQSGFIDVVVNGTGSHIDFDYTEANFYKAYDECVRLFKGEE